MPGPGDILPEPYIFLTDAVPCGNRIYGSLTKYISCPEIYHPNLKQTGNLCTKITSVILDSTQLPVYQVQSVPNTNPLWTSTQLPPGMKNVVFS